MLSRLYKSLPGNVTTELGLELGDLADTARPYPEVVRILQEAEGGSFVGKLDAVRGGPEWKRGLERFLAKYGMRCTGEIDITRPRWNESQLLASLLSNIRTSAAGEHREKFRRGELEAEQAAKEIVGLFGFMGKR